MITINDTYTLSNGVKMPVIGLGTYRSTEDYVVTASVNSALELGYRLIDTATYYKNEHIIGNAVKHSPIPREDIFVTTKVWNADRGYDKAIASVRGSLERMGLSYIDLVLIHWPAAAHQFDNWRKINADTINGLAALYKDGLIKSIGVSNFMPHHLEPLMELEVAPMVNQIEFHPGCAQLENADFSKSCGLAVQAWSPFGIGKVLNNELIISIGKKYGKTAAQVCVRWCIQHGIAPLPKSDKKERIAENANVFDFALLPEDMLAIDNMPFTGYYHHPDHVNF